MHNKKYNKINILQFNRLKKKKMTNDNYDSFTYIYIYT